RPEQGALVGVGVPGPDYLAAVPRGEEVVGADAADVEPERAAGAAAVERIAGADQPGEDAGGPLHPDRAGHPAVALPDLRDLGPGDAVVDGDRDPAQRVVHVPRDALDA